MNSIYVILVGLYEYTELYVVFKRTGGEFFKFVRGLLIFLVFSCVFFRNLFSQPTQDTGAEKRRCNWLLKIQNA